MTVTLPDNLEELNESELRALNGAAAERIHQLRADDSPGKTFAEQVAIETEIAQMKAIARIVGPMRTALESAEARERNQAELQEKMDAMSDEEFEEYMRHRESLRQTVETEGFDTTEVPEEF